MTTPQAAALYEAQHMIKWAGKGYASFNPHDKPVEELPVIYGFNNGGSPGLFYGCIMAEDGTGLGGHGCSSEGYMLSDLGVLEGSRPDRHETFRTHYPDGYRMEFVSYSDVEDTPGLMLAFERNKAQAIEARRAETLQDGSVGDESAVVATSDDAP
jgi:hypothetical protein